MEETIIKNAIIEKAELYKNECGISIRLIFDYGLGENLSRASNTFSVPIFSVDDPKITRSNFESKAGYFIMVCMSIAGVESWDEIKGKAIRVKIEKGEVVAIGHIVNSSRWWFLSEIELNNNERKVYP